MFGLAYLSTENRRALEILQERVSRISDRKHRREAELAIQDIRAKEKPYTECDLAECEDLRFQLLNKISILQRLGKSTESFRMHLKEVDFFIQTLQMKESLKEEARVKTDESPNLKDRTPNVRTLKDERTRKAAFGQRRWQIGFEDEPDDE